MTGLSLDSGEQTWSLLADHVEAFIAGWESDGAPDLRDHLPTDRDGTSLKSVRRMVLVELIKIDVEYRLQMMPIAKPIEDYLEEFSELNDGELPADLLYEDFHLRLQAGHDVEAASYLARFPQQAEMLAQLLDVDSPYSCTRLQSGEQQEMEAVSEGDRIDDFELLTELGRGAFARVFLARQGVMQRLVALKISANRGSEAQTLAQMDHEAIVRVFDVRDLPERSLRLLYMQYLPGGTLHDVVARVRLNRRTDRTGADFLKVVDDALEARGAERPAGSIIRMRVQTYDWPATVAWAGSVLARGLHYAHEHGVLHRDVKPANVLLSAEGVPKLADFNISFSNQIAGTTPAAYFGGSLAYMSPEQLRACHPGRPEAPDTLDGRSDLYSLSVMLWELLTSQRPFGDEQTEGDWNITLDAMIARREEPPCESDLPADCPTGLTRELCRCLSPNANDRPANGEQLGEALELCLHPEAERLLNPKPGRFRALAEQWCFWLYMMCALVPNALAGWFNFVYNKRMIIDPMPEATRDAFMQTQSAVNAIAFPIGMGLAAWYIWPVCQRVRQQRRNSVSPAVASPELRNRCLNFGRVLATVSVVEWLLAGLVYPITLHFTAGEMTAESTGHFVASLAICGVIAATYPYFLAITLGMRIVYPRLRAGRVRCPEDMPSLHRLRHTSFWFLLFGLSPVFAAILLELLVPEARFALIILLLCGFAGAILQAFLYNRLQKNLDALFELDRSVGGVSG